MKTIIAGSRSISSYALVHRAIEASGIADQITEVVSGHAAGVDITGEKWANSKGIPVKVLPAEWGIYKKAAGKRRNIEMALYADALIAIWDGRSTGTKHMIKVAEGMGLRVFVWDLREEKKRRAVVV